MNWMGVDHLINTLEELKIELWLTSKYKYIECISYYKA